MICNIDAAGRRRRRRQGGIALAATVALVAFLVLVEARPLTALLVFPGVYAAASGFLQARRGTCTGRATMGQREEEGVGYAIEDPEELAQIRRQARAIIVQSALGGLLATAVATAVLYAV